MPRLTKIYTRQGDDGMTSLGSKQRVPKESLRVSAYGTVDELNSQIGVAVAFGLAPRLAETLPVIQNELFHLGSDLAFTEEDKQTYKIPEIAPRHVAALEKLIDELNEVVGPLENFILPGGSLGAAQLHVARTVCRRAERETVALTRSEAVGAQVIPYLNRLSDLLFVMARYENNQRDIPEPLWDTLR
jgi:cob(I)alamin adenosyltransferase